MKFSWNGKFNFGKMVLRDNGTTPNFVPDNFILFKLILQFSLCDLSRKASKTPRRSQLSDESLKHMLFCYFSRAFLEK